MVNKKIIRNSSVTLTSLVIYMLLAIGIFTGMFLYLQDQADLGGVVTVDSKYNTTYTQLTEATTSLDNNINAIKDNLNNVKEADEIYQVAWNGLKGLGNTLRLPVSFVSSGVEITVALFIPLDIIPSWAKTLIQLGIVAIIVFVVLAILKGDPKL